MVDLWRTFIDPLHGDGYQWWSGVGSGSPVLAGIGVYLRHHNCHVKGCWRLQFKPHPDDKSHLLCRRHHRTPKESSCR